MTTLLDNYISFLPSEGQEAISIAREECQEPLSILSAIHWVAHHKDVDDKLGRLLVGEINKILTGQYLSPTTNPYSQALYDQMAGDITSGVQSQFTKAGRLGSAANQEVLAKELGKVANQVYGDQYNRERANMMAATQLAPQLAQADYDDISQLGQVGAVKEDLEMAKIQDALSRFDFEQNKPYFKLREYLASIGSPYAQTTSQTQPIFRNTGAGLLGGAMTGAKLGGMIPGLGAGMGALGGGLLGGFF